MFRGRVEVICTLAIKIVLSLGAGSADIVMIWALAFSAADHLRARIFWACNRTEARDVTLRAAKRSPTTTELRQYDSG